MKILLFLMAVLFCSCRSSYITNMVVDSVYREKDLVIVQVKGYDSRGKERFQTFQADTGQVYTVGAPVVILPK